MRYKEAVEQLFLFCFFVTMESCSALQKNNTPYRSYGMLCTESEVIPKLQINVQAKNSKYSESKTLLNVSSVGNSENGISEESFKQMRKLRSEPTESVNGDLEKEVLIHRSDENGVSDLDSSTGVGKASSGYCTDTSGADESITSKVTPPMCSENFSLPTSSSAANEVQPARRSANTRSRNTKMRVYSLRPRSKPTTTRVPDPQPQDLLPFDVEKLLHCDYKPVTSEEIYLRKLIQQLDSSYTKAVVQITRLENMDPSLWRKYLSK